MRPAASSSSSSRNCRQPKCTRGDDLHCMYPCRRPRARYRKAARLGQSEATGRSCISSSYHLGSATPPDHSSVLRYVMKEALPHRRCLNPVEILIPPRQIRPSQLFSDWIARMKKNIFRFLLIPKELTTACDCGSVRQFIRTAGLRSDKRAKMNELCLYKPWTT